MYQEDFHITHEADFVGNGGGSGSKTLNPIDFNSKIPDKSTFKDPNVNIDPSLRDIAEREVKKGKKKMKRKKPRSCNAMNGNGSHKLPRKNFLIN